MNSKISTFAAMAVGGLMVLIAPKNGWYPLTIAFGFWLRERWRVPWRWIILGATLSAAALFAGVAGFTGAAAAAAAG